MKYYCTGCGKDVDARLTNGEERYPHRPDLYEIPFWRCDGCGNYVGCHWKTRSPLTPLGCIASPDILNARKHIHNVLDPIWKSGKMSRGAIYGYLTGELKHKYRREHPKGGLSYQYHTGEIRSIEEARDAYRALLKLKGELE